MASLKVYMPLADQRFGLWAFKSTLDRLGVSISAFPEDADSVLPLSDASAAKITGHPRYMPMDSMDKILNRDRLHETGLRVLPTTVVQKPEDAADGMMVKPRNSVTGGWVCQPHMGFPVDDLDIHFSVNANSEVFVIAAQRHESLDYKQFGRLRMASSGEYVGVVEQIEAACKRLEIKGGIHDIQFLSYQGEWCAIDWNPRVPQVYNEGLPNKYPCLDGAIQHMLGLPVTSGVKSVFINRAYWANPIPTDKRALIESFGLMPRQDYRRKVSGFVRINGVGATEEEINAKFDAMESAL